MSNYSISPQVAAQVVLGTRPVNSAELTAPDRKMIARMELCGARDAEGLERYARMYMDMFRASP